MVFLKVAYELFLSSTQPLFQGESTCEVLVMNISLIRTNDHHKNFSQTLHYTTLYKTIRLSVPRTAAHIREARWRYGIRGNIYYDNRACAD